MSIRKKGSGWQVRVRPFDSVNGVPTKQLALEVERKLLTKRSLGEMYAEPVEPTTLGDEIDSFLAWQSSAGGLTVRGYGFNMQSSKFWKPFRETQVARLSRVTNLTPRQQAALAAIQAAGYDGLHTDEVGAAVHAWQGNHAADERCEWCGTVGRELGRVLRRDGLAKQRRVKAPGGDTYMVWVTADAKPVRVVADPDVNPFPKGF